MRFKLIWQMAIIVGALTGAVKAGASDSDEVKRLLLSAKTDQGLCVYVNTGGSRSMSVELAANSRMLVHEICFDEETRAETEAAINKGNVAGQVSRASTAPPGRKPVCIANPGVPLRFTPGYFPGVPPALEVGI